MASRYRSGLQYNAEEIIPDHASCRRPFARVARTPRKPGAFCQRAINYGTSPHRPSFRTRQFARSGCIRFNMARAA